MRDKTFFIGLGLVVVSLLAVSCARADDGWEARREVLKNRPRPLILNSDGNEVIYWRTNLPVTAENFTAQRLATYRGSRVSTVSYCPQSSGFGYMTTTRAGEFFDVPRCIPELQPACLNAAPLLKAKGFDCLDLTADYCHTNGMEVFVSIRVNDTHDVSYFIPGTNPPRSYLFPKWKEANPDCLFGSCSNRPPFCAWTAVDFENPKTRDHMKTFVGDFVNNYDVDGIEYDFFRHGQLFKSVGWGACATEAQLKLMTDFMLELRAITEAAGRKRGRPVLVLVRTSDSLGYAKAQGIDVEAWLRRGAMDIWSVSDYFQLDYLRPNAELAHRYGVKFYSALAESRVPRAFAREKAKNGRLAKAVMLPGRNTIASYAAEYSAAMAAGCDGISSFNLSCTGGISKRGLMDVDPRRTKDLDKVYFALVRGSGGYLPESWVKDGGRFYVRPRIDPARLFKIPTGRPCVFGIEFGDEDWPRFDMVAKAALADGRNVIAELKVNGKTVAPGAFKDGVHAFPLQPGDLKPGYNEFTVTVDPKFGPAVAFHDFAVYLRKRAERPLAGVIRWDCWAGKDGVRGGEQTRVVEKTLTPAKYRWRLPWFAEVKADGSVSIDGAKPGVMEREIDYAADAGLDYFIFLNYGINSHKTDAVDRFRAAENSRRMRYAMCFMFYKVDIPDEIWPQTVAKYIACLDDENYVRVCGNRPLVYTMHIGGEELNARVRELKSAAAARGLDPYFVYLNNTPDEMWPKMKELGYDAYGMYATAKGLASGPCAYYDFATNMEDRVQGAALRKGHPCVPCCQTGWQKDPRKDFVPYWEKGLPYHSQKGFPAVPTPEEIAASIVRVREFVKSHPETCPANTFTVYAWNEHDEGGWLCPTWTPSGRPDTSRLDAIRRRLP